MLRLKYIFIGILGFFLLSQCIRPFEADSFDFEKVIVVDGLITDQMKSHQVLLNYNFPIGEPEVLPVGNAEVWVEGSDIGRIDFVEKEPGVYESNTSFAADKEESYQLFFNTEGGAHFYSSEMGLIPSPPIDSIYDRYSEIATDESSSNKFGIQFFLDTHDDSEKAKYFRYEWEDTYQIVTPYTSWYEYNPSSETYAPRTTLINKCYLGSSSKSLVIGNSIGNNTNRLVEFPIRFVDGDKDYLRNRYSILARQFAISESAYSYYRKLKESNESGGSLFDKQQGSILGNISSATEGELVQGFFEVSGVSELRAFFSYAELDKKLPLPKYRYPCGDHNFIHTTEDSVAYYMTTTGLFKIHNVSVIDDFASLGPKLCLDCSQFASTHEPDFWID